MRRLFPWITILLVYILTPGALEIAENAAHLVAHWDTAHSADDDHEQPTGTDEHGCSGPYHFCSCHHSSSFITVRPALVSAPVATVDPESPAGDVPVDSGFVPSLFRPPSA